MNTQDISQAAPAAPAPWWRFGHVWLIISGPAAVVAAGLVTVWIAIDTADGLVAEDYYRKGLEAGRARAHALAPAVQARNHAATAGNAP